MASSSQNNPKSRQQPPGTAHPQNPAGPMGIGPNWDRNRAEKEAGIAYRKEQWVKAMNLRKTN